jgi:dipeptidyl aminopeptidase/acylaminoacyl peptidase
MNHRTIRQSRALVFALTFLLLAPVSFAQAAPVKRPISHRDYDSWRAIQNQKLSPDGKYVGYALFPQEGDGELVVRNIETGKEFREAVGARPAPPPPNPLGEVTGEMDRPQARGITVGFTPDSKMLVFSTFPTKAEVDKAKRDKKKPEEMPKGGMVIMDLASGAVTRVQRVKGFQIAEKSSTWLVYQKEAEPERKATKPEVKSAETKAEPAKDGEEAKKEDSAKDKDKKKEYGSELVLRNLVVGVDRTFADVSEYAITKDGSMLIYAVASKKEETNGIYAVASLASCPCGGLITGKGKYSKLTIDENQTTLAFVSDRDDQASKTPKFKLYAWDFKSPAPVEIAASSTIGLQRDYVISEKATLSFSRDGKRLFFGVSIAQHEKPKDELLDDEKVSADLWSWKDDSVQPMQKSRAQLDKNRSYRAVYHFDLKKAVQLGDVTLPEIMPSENGLWAIGTDNREYRPMIEYGIRVSDSYLVDTITGERKPIAKKQFGRLQWSPDGKYLINYDGKDWVSTAVPSLASVNLTSKLGVSFANEEDDHPDVPEAYGSGGWTRDGKFVLIYDRYDVWQFSPDGKVAKKLTDGRKGKLHLRYVRVNTDSKDPDDRWIDPAKPFLLSAESEDTRDSGFYRTRLDSAEPPQKLIFAAESFSNPVKAKDADVLMFTAQRFDQFPDLQVADTDFRKPTRVSDANPQKAQLLWGNAELVSYRNADGVPLKAALYKPENFDSKKKYPMMVYIYEKLSQNVNQFVNPAPGTSINVAYYVSNGYLVLTPDIVYTVGYPGQSALKCVLAAIDNVIDRGYVDEKAIGIQGHSWGGYQIAYMVTQTNRFRAAAAGAPVSDMISAYDGIRWGSGLPRQFQYEHTQSRIGGSIWEYPMRYFENSPVLQADRVQTPLMILHNDADDMVPWYQGIEYFLALRRLGKEVYMFSYNGEPHGLRRRADQKDYTVRLQQYFDHFLKGAPAPDWMLKGIPFLAKDEEKVRFNAEAYGKKGPELNAETAPANPSAEKKSVGGAQ